jgi:hypothetical protein
MPTLTPAELQEARKRSGRLGGRPRKPTVEEARRAALDELVPKALRVLNEHLDTGGPDAWRAALRVFEHAYGRAPEQPADDVGLPDNPDDVASLSWEQLKILALRHADEIEDNGRPAGRTVRRPTEI